LTCCRLPRLLLLLLLLVCEYVDEVVQVKQVPVHPLQQLSSAAAQIQHSVFHRTPQQNKHEQHQLVFPDTTGTHQKGQRTTPARGGNRHHMLKHTRGYQCQLNHTHLSAMTMPM
jgi:hypothetical protein